jgi:hypothetical protein
MGYFDGIGDLLTSRKKGPDADDDAHVASSVHPEVRWQGSIARPK